MSEVERFPMNSKKNKKLADPTRKNEAKTESQRVDGHARRVPGNENQIGLDGPKGCQPPEATVGT